MLRSAMQSFGMLVWLIPAFVGVTSAETIVFGPVTIYNFTLTKQHNPRQYLSQFSKHTDVHFINPVWPSMTAEMLQQLTEMTNFLCGVGEMKVFHVIPQLEELKLDACQTTDLVIDPGQSHNLWWLYVAHANLRRVPANLKSLTQLEQLFLPNNSIEYLNMDDFSGLSKLLLLELSDNKIARISSSLDSRVQLPNLRTLSLRFNELTEMCFENWNAPMLYGVDLHGNKLSMVQSLERLPQLKAIKLRDNPFDCSWLHRTLSSLTKRNVTFYGRDNVSCV